MSRPIVCVWSGVWQRRSRVAGSVARSAELRADVTALLGSLRAKAFVASQAGESGSRDEQIAHDVADLSIGALLDENALFEAGEQKAAANTLASARGRLSPMAVKPIMFDLAEASIEFESFASRTQQKKSGWFGSLFG